MTSPSGSVIQMHCIPSGGVTCVMTVLVILSSDCILPLLIISPLISLQVAHKSDIQYRSIKTSRCVVVEWACPVKTVGGNRFQNVATLRFLKAFSWLEDVLAQRLIKTVLGRFKKDALHGNFMMSCSSPCKL